MTVKSFQNANIDAHIGNAVVYSPVQAWRSKSMNQATNDLLEKIKRIKKLAENGIGGERESAQTMLKKLMRKHKISEDELISENVEEVWFKYKDDCERKLLVQIFYFVKGDGRYWERKDKRCKSLGVDCNIAQKLEIEANYEFFKHAIREELEVFYMAFFSKNNIFPQSHKNQKEPPTKELLKVAMMMEGMNERSLLKQIGSEKR